MARRIWFAGVLVALLPINGAARAEPSVEEQARANLQACCSELDTTDVTTLKRGLLGRTPIYVSILDIADVGLDRNDYQIRSLKDDLQRAGLDVRIEPEGQIAPGDGSHVVSVMMPSDEADFDKAKRETLIHAIADPAPLMLAGQSVDHVVDSIYRHPGNVVVQSVAEAGELRGRAAFYRMPVGNVLAMEAFATTLLQLLGYNANFKPLAYGSYRMRSEDDGIFYPTPADFAALSILYGRLRDAEKARRPAHEPPAP